MIDARQDHLGEFGLIVPQGAANAELRISIVEDPDSGSPADVSATLNFAVILSPRLEFGLANGSSPPLTRRREVQRMRKRSYSC